ncbi:unnamed protein product [Trichobilharzia szidati]|nr:unnamed protein product [Trichobilharzia szidati]
MNVRRVVFSFRNLCLCRINGFATVRLPIPGVDNVLLISSAKGGVGKSTVAVNLALALQQHVDGGNIGVLDADVFGPSIPRMLKLEGISPEVDKMKRIIPLTNYNIKCMSMGFLVGSESAVTWRGLMVMSAIQQLLRQVHWGPLHTLVVDMPPGTGDVQLSICQNVPVQGAIIVTTPQAVATTDAHKGIDMFRKLNIPICGIVENMSEYICPSCGHHEPLFDNMNEGKSGGERLAEITNLPLLARIPIDPQLVRACDNGEPIIVSKPESKTSSIYKELADITIKRLHILKSGNIHKNNSSTQQNGILYNRK